MIHSLSGGELKQYDIYNFVKIEFEKEQGKYFWYISPFDDLKVGDYVLAPFGIVNELQKAKVIAFKKNVNGQITPIPTKRAKTIFKKL